MIAFGKERLANFKVPRQVEFVDALPRNLSGKVLKTELRVVSRQALARLLNHETSTGVARLLNHRNARWLRRLRSNRLENTGRRLMDLTLSESELAFQAEAREWLAANVPAEPLPSMDTAEGFAAHQEWEAKLAEARWSVVSWPEEYGGREASLVEWVIFEEEYYRAGAPGRVSQNGIFLLAPIIFDHGTQEQQDRFLPTMATGEQIWAQGWSEPEAGSDLASLRRPPAATTSAAAGCSTARRPGRRGRRTRTGASGSSAPTPRRSGTRGLTYFLFPLDADGITVRPIAQLDGEAGFAEIFFEDVFVPDSDVLGAPGDGWRVAMSTAGNERGLSLRSPGRFCAAADRLVELYRAWFRDTRANSRWLRRLRSNRLETT